MRLGDSYNVADLKPRAVGLAVAFLGFLLILVGRLWFLQIWKGDEYRLFSDQNRFKVHSVSAPRGRIFDRNGRLLADNRPRFDVVYTRGHATDMEKEFDLLAEIFQWDAEQKERLLTRSQRSAPYYPRRIARDIPWDQLAKIEALGVEISGAEVDVLAVRDYPYGDAFFHVIGYPGEINEADLERLSKRFPERNYRIGDEIGVIGVEALFEGLLRGRDGREFFIVDVKGRRVQRSDSDLFDREAAVESVAGHDLFLSLDLGLQLTTIDAFNDQIGAAVAIDPSTGEILAMVSRPGIDPNLFTREVSSKTLLKLRNRIDKPFLDRTLGEHYPPGSTFKLVMAMAALQEGVVEPDTILNCPGFYRLGRRVWHEHNRAGFGRIDIREAIKKSSNVFFFQVGEKLGLDTMAGWATQFGLGAKTQVGSEIMAFEDRKPSRRRFNFEVPGFIPTVQWVNEKGHTTVRAETTNAGIGQGGFLATITQLANMTATLVNDGKHWRPQLLRQVRNLENNKMVRIKPKLEHELRLDPENVQVIKQGIYAVVNEQGGTAPRARSRKYSIGGKTGTSQVVGLKQVEGLDDEEIARRLRDHALFVAAAPIEEPKIAVAVIVEHGQSGGRAAGPIAKAMIEHYLDSKVREVEVGQQNPR